MLKGEDNAGAEESCSGAARSCCAGAMHSMGGFSGGSNELLNSGGFCSAAVVCQHLPQCPSPGRLLSLGIMHKCEEATEVTGCKLELDQPKDYWSIV